MHAQEVLKNITSNKTIKFAEQAVSWCRNKIVCRTNMCHLSRVSFGLSYRTFMPSVNSAFLVGKKVPKNDSQWTVHCLLRIHAGRISRIGKMKFAFPQMHLLRSRQHLLRAFVVSRQVCDKCTNYCTGLPGDRKRIVTTHSQVQLCLWRPRRPVNVKSAHLPIRRQWLLQQAIGRHARQSCSTSPGGASTRVLYLRICRRRSAACLNRMLAAGVWSSCLLQARS